MSKIILHHINLRQLPYQFFSPNVRVPPKLKTIIGDLAQTDGVSVPQINLSQKIINMRGYVKSASGDITNNAINVLNSLQGRRGIELNIDDVIYKGFVLESAFPHEPHEISAKRGNIKFFVPTGTGTGQTNQPMFSKLSSITDRTRTISTTIGGTYRSPAVIKITFKAAYSNTIEIIGSYLGLKMSIRAQNFSNGDVLEMDGIKKEFRVTDASDGITRIRSSDTGDGIFPEFYNGDDFTIKFGANVRYDLEGFADELFL